MQLNMYYKGCNALYVKGVDSELNIHYKGCSDMYVKGV